MEENKKTRYAPVVVILGVFIILTIALVGQQIRAPEAEQSRHLTVLDEESFKREESTSEKKEEPRKECLYLWDGGDDSSVLLHEQMTQILHDMKISWDETDVSKQKMPDPKDYQMAILGMGYYGGLQNEMMALIDWVQDGGNVLMAQVPILDAVSGWVGQNCGISNVGNQYYATPGLRLKDDFLLCGDKRDYPIEEPFQCSLMVNLRGDCSVHLVSSDEKEIPILWECPLGEGRTAVMNLGIYDKAYRGFYAAAVSCLGEVCAYPVINASSFYIDDFPSPVPSGESQYIKRDYGIDVGDFYSNVWWSDMLDLAETYGIRYTGLIIEDYSDLVEAPFPSNRDVQRFRYFGDMLLEAGGELGFHGYNHMPLCLEDFDFMDMYDMYQKWKTEEDMAESLRELKSFAGRLFSKAGFRVYVPPSNILSEKGREVLLRELPELQAIASTYLPGGPAYDQEFEVSKEGVVETPRIISGYLLDDYMQLSALSELNFHYVSSHFEHPDDVLDEDRGAELGWEVMRNRLEDYLKWLQKAGGPIRNMTGTEMAGAVQRFYYLEVERETDEEGLHLTLSKFQDEAWLLVRFNEWEPEEVTGGELTRLSDDLYLLEAKEKKIDITRKKKVEA